MKKYIFLLLSVLLIISCDKKKQVLVDRNEIIAELNIFMDAWHNAAATADEDVFFGSLDSNAVYLGTDPKERWLKHEFQAWAMPYFQREVAWAFKPYNRVWEFSADYQFAWFDELLETHMGICRGSGVLIKNKDGWKLKHYNLALTLPNEKMKEFRLIQGIEAR